MRQAWMIKTHGKPLETVIRLFTYLWDRLNISHMLLPLKNLEDNSWGTEEISDPKELVRANPFTPLMVENISKVLPEFQHAHPDENVAVLLRPCEVMALNKIKGKVDFNWDNLVVFSADCLGTYPPDEFVWRADRKGSHESLTEESYKFSKIGGISQYRYRSACQLCKNPVANQGDLNINIAGLPVRHKIMVSTYNGINQKVSLASITDGRVPDDLLTLHDQISEKMIYRNEQTRERLSKALVENTELDIENLVDQLNQCDECQICMDVCPMCNVFGFSRESDGRLSRETVANWMVECVGCGMCEQSCAKHKPLAVIFAVVHDQLVQMSI